MGRSASDILGDHGVILDEDELAHFGVKGMRWGKRKKQTSSDSEGSDGSTSKPAKPDVKKMTDDELKSAINRLKLEKEYLKLTEPEISNGKKIVTALLKDVGDVSRKQAKTYLNQKIENALKEGLKDAAKTAGKEAAKVGAQMAIEAAISKASGGSARPTVKFTPRAQTTVKL